MQVVETLIVVPVWKERVLLLQRSDEERAYPGLLAFPRGQMAELESMKDCSARVLREQAGFHPGVSVELPSESDVLRFGGKVFSINRCLAMYRDRPQVSPSCEFLGYVWVDHREAKQLPLAGPIVNSTLDMVPAALETAKS